MKKIFQLINGSFKLSVLCAALSLTPAAFGDTMVGFWNFNTGTANSVTPTESLTLSNANITGGTLNAQSGGGYASGSVSNLPLGASPFTISAFLKTTAANSQGIMGWGNYAGNQCTAFRTNSEDNSGGNGFKHYWWGNDLAPNGLAGTWGTSVISGSWNHVVATSNGGNQTVYMNGQYLGGRNASGTHNTQNANFAIGATNSFSEKLNGSIDNASLYSTEMSHADIINISSSRYNGLISWWAAEDYVTGQKWIDRVGGVAATPTSVQNATKDANGNAVAGAAGTTTPIATTTGVEFNRLTGLPEGLGDNWYGGDYFAISGSENPVAGLTSYTILTSFTPDSAGTGAGSFYQTSGLVGAEQAGATADWGLGYNRDSKMVAGYGNTNGANGGDFGLISSGSVAVDTNAVAGYTLNNGDVRVWINGAQDNQANKISVARNSGAAMYIGRMGADQGMFDGEIHDILIFDRALVSSEMAYYSGQIAPGHDYVIGTDPAAWDAAKTAWIRDAATVDAAALTITTAPLGLYLGGTTGAVVVNNASVDFLNSTNRTLALGGSTLNIPTGETGFTKTLDIDGGKVTKAGSLNMANDSRITVSSGALTINDCFRVGTAGSGSEVYQSGGTVSVNAWFTMGEGGSSSYTMDGGTLNVWMNGRADGNRCTVIGDTTGTATFNLNGGTFTTNNAPLQIGKKTNATGILNMAGGSLTTPEMILGMSGTGTLNYSGGTLGMDKITVNATGTIKGDATPTTKFNLGGAKAQTMDIKGGSVTTGTLYLGTNNAATINISSGSLTMTSGEGVDSENRIGGATATENKAKGTINQSGGTITANSNLQIGSYGEAEYNMTGGTFNTNSSWVCVGRFPTGVGTMTVGGGSALATVNVTNYGLIIAEQGKGTLNIKENARLNFTNSQLNVGHSTGGGAGIVNQTGGLVVTPTIIIYDSKIAGAANQYNLSGGFVSVGSLSGADKLAWTNGNIALTGTAKVTGNLTQGGGALHLGNPYQKDLNWSRVKLAGFSDGYPGYAAESGAWNQTTQEQNDAFWAKVATRSPEASGAGVIGAGNIASNDPNNYFTLVYTGSVWIENAGEYTFNQKADDGGFILIDGETVSHMSAMDRTDPWGQNSINTPVTLDTGWHDFEYRYYDGWGGNNISALTMTDSAGKVTDFMNASTDILFHYEPEYVHAEILGNYTQAEDATIYMDVNATTGEFDQLSVTGNMQLDGILELNLMGANTLPEDIQMFKVSDGATMALGFSEIVFPDGFTTSALWDVSGLMAGGDGVLRYHGVPEPATWVLLVLGLGAVGVYRNRKRTIRL